MTAAGTLERTRGGTPVWVSGAGRTVVLVHGVLMDHRMWAAQVRALSPRYRVCCMDMLGHGDAPHPPGERRLDDFVAQVHEVVERYSDAGPPVLGGFSMGGLVAQAYAVRHHAALAGLILMSAVYERTPEESAVVRDRYAAMESGGVESAVVSAGERWFTARERADRAADVERILGWMRDGAFAPKLAAHRVFATSDGETAGRLGAVSCPGLVLTGDGDAGSTPEMARRMAAALPDAELHILDGQRHMMPVLDAPRVNAVVLGFLARALPRAG